MTQSKLAVVTGASGGIGAAIARQLSNAGWRCLLLGRNEEKLSLLRHQLGPQHEYLAIDLAQPQSHRKVVLHALTMGGVALLVNCAGGNKVRAFSDMSPEDIQQQLVLNLHVPMLLTQSFLVQLSQSSGTVINVGSAFGYIGFPYQSIYCASKFGLRGFSEALSRELDGRVNVKYFAPRATDTSLNDDDMRSLNKELGNNVDSPERVAKEFMQLLNSRKRRWVVGFPEKAFVRINGLLPELVDSAIIKQLKTITRCIRGQFNTKESSS
ncbi:MULTISPECIES: SDR family oxidoreductase [Pseudoalteromonas]|uniref:Short chain dehydrogenase n=1 Tax=Pseudoalteromonas amylolytica TaxID=1859457 RepID=A0A1S1MPG7_9GAMM|nr:MULTISPECIES: SDR family oxidoreductase [Pseudoalteromonas]OHU85008.1 short chain dehydrogenase [Pseudoalteromonas sp. JW3]OHU90041.1 short chain dehydrogenase [Pseudoalteromonas amylolytica]